MPDRVNHIRHPEAVEFGRRTRDRSRLPRLMPKLPIFTSPPNVFGSGILNPALRSCKFQCAELPHTHRNHITIVPSAVYKLQCSMLHAWASRPSHFPFFFSLVIVRVGKLAGKTRNTPDTADQVDQRRHVGRPMSNIGPPPTSASGLGCHDSCPRQVINAVAATTSPITPESTISRQV